MRVDRPGLGLAAIVAAYLGLGAAYAVRTPMWQVPDEPAHFNYVRQVSDDTPDPPEIAVGDYPFERIEQLKAAGFPPGADIAGIDYEDHQPPAYYYLAAVAYRWAGGDPIPGESAGQWPWRVVRLLRLLGVLLGAIAVALTWRVGRLVDPDPLVALGAAAFVAFLPMHLTMTAAVNNDPLANAVMALALVVALRRVAGDLPRRRFVAAGGIVIGLAAWTKVTVLAPAVAVVVAAEAVGWWRAHRFGGLAAAATAAETVGLGALIGLPWFARNGRVYGAGDWLALRAHDLAVACQPGGAGCQARTADWIAEHGPAAYLARLAVFTFQSFWGVFGWMGVFLTSVGGIPVYAALAVASLIAAAGSVGFLRRAEPPTRFAAAVLAVNLGVVVAGYAWYNLTFVQHQGRYLFGALVPIAVVFATGYREAGRWTAAALRLPTRQARWVEIASVAGFSAALAGLAWVSLTRFIVPGLG